MFFLKLLNKIKNNPVIKEQIAKIPDINKNNMVQNVINSKDQILNQYNRIIFIKRYIFNKYRLMLMLAGGMMGMGSTLYTLLNGDLHDYLDNELKINDNKLDNSNVSKSDAVYQISTRSVRSGMQGFVVGAIPEITIPIALYIHYRR